MQALRLVPSRYVLHSLSSWYTYTCFIHCLHSLYSTRRRYRAALPMHPPVCARPDSCNNTATLPHVLASFLASGVLKLEGDYESDIVSYCVYVVYAGAQAWAV